MTQVPATQQTTSTTGQSPQNNTLKGLETDDFLKLMISELQNQDPLNPMENSEMLQQITQIREIGATQSLTKTLDSVLLGQNISSATNLLGTQVRALTDDGENATGVVHKVGIQDGEAQLEIDGSAAVEPYIGEGELEEGTYRYRVVVTDEEGYESPLAYDVGSASVQGRQGVDQAIQLLNLPESEGLKKIYRTNSSGEGSYYLLNSISGNLTNYVDGTPDSGLTKEPLTKASGGPFPHRNYTIKLTNVSEINAINR